MSEIMPHWLTKQAQLAPNKIAIETANRKLTFLQLKKESEVLAEKLASLGIKKHSKVAILSPNKLEMIITIHALSYLQAVIVMLNTKLTKKELEYQLQASTAEIIITTEELRVQKQLDHINQKTYEEINKHPRTRIELATHIHLANSFTMMFTSGTTGHPKLVRHTYGNHWWSAISSVLNLGLKDNDKWLIPLPMFHVGGFSILMKSVIYGISVFMMEKYEAEKIYSIINDRKVTIASFVTVMLRHLLEDLETRDLPAHLRCILLGGGSVPEVLLHKVEEKQVPLFQSYGLTETSSQIATLSLQDALVKLGSSGKPLLPAEIMIEHQNKEGIGEIWVRGPMVMDGYVNNENANQISFENGWFKTGDLGYTDNEGFLYVIDRRSDLIISGGENIYPSEIEHALLEMNKIKEAAVVGKKDEYWGEVPVAFIVINEAIELEEIEFQLREALASYKIPKEFHIVKSLPKNASNKIMRHQLKAQLQA